MAKKRHNKEAVRNLVMTTITYRLNEKDALNFIERVNETGRISPSFYHKLKRELLSRESLTEYFEEQARIGFVRDHRLRSLEIEEVLTKLMRAFGNVSQDCTLDMSRLTKAIILASRRAHEISLDNQVIHEIKKQADRARFGRRKIENKPNEELSERKF